MPRLRLLSPLKLEEACLNTYYSYIKTEMALICSLEEFEQQSLLMRRFRISSHILFHTLRHQLEFGLKGILQDMVKQKLVDLAILEFPKALERGSHHMYGGSDLTGGMVSTPAPLRHQYRLLLKLLDFLLDSSISSINLNPTQAWPETEDLEVTKALWKVIASHCPQLKRLVVPKELTYLSSMNPIFQQGNFLTHLTLKRNVPNNMFLSLVAETCPVLEELDIAGAEVVTDFGIVCLLLTDPEQMILECWNREKTVGSVRNSQKAFPHPHFDRPIPDPNESSQMPSGASGAVAVGGKWHHNHQQYLHLKRSFYEVLKDEQNFSWQSSKLCQTLRKIRLENTKVKGDGAALLLELCPNLFSMGYLVFAAAGLKQVFGAERRVATKFTEIFYRGPSDQKLQAIANCCPSLETMFLGSNTLRSLNATMFATWTELSFLTLENIIVRDVSSCLKLVGHQLVGLKLQCSDFDLEQVARLCPRLHSLVVQKESPLPISGTCQAPPDRVFQCLAILEVTCPAFPRCCLNYVIRNALVLKDLRVFHVPDLGRASIMSWANGGPQLETFVIQKAPQLDRECVDILIDLFPRLKVLGDFASFALRRPTEFKRLGIKCRDEAWDLNLLDTLGQGEDDEKKFSKVLTLHWFYLTGKKKSGEI